ncbi:MAG: hypothetical protein EXS14_02415 [Planctomycetes bacterium]|nr:hypothetical protein [Planctomycetota bacterium]
MRAARFIAIVALMATVASAQVITLQTTLQGGNGQKGNMFNVKNISAGTVSVTSFDQNFFAAGTSAMEIYTKTGSFVGSEALAANWTLVGSAAGVVSGGPGVAVPLPITVGVAIPSGATQAFYVTVTNATATNVAYTNGNLVVPATTAGAVAFSDANIQFVCGVGISYPFGTTFGGPTPGGLGRCWNGKIKYQVGGVASEYQVNQTNCALNFNGVLAAPFNPASITLCNGSIVTATSATTAGLPYDIGLYLGAQIPRSSGAIALPDGQLFHLSFAQTIWLFGGSFGAFVPSPGTFQVPFAAFPTTLSAQSVAIDGAMPLGIALSQASSVTGIAPGAVALTLGDDSNVLIDLATSLTCPPSSLPFYGTSYTQVQALSNGRLMFGGFNNGFTPTVAQTLLDAPSFGVWTDLNPALGGTVTATSLSGTGLAVAFAAVPYFATTIPNSFTLSVDISGAVLFDGLTGIAAGAGNAWFGASRGNTGATDPGITAFALGGPNAGPAGTGALYNFGLQGAATAGINQLLLTPNAINYDWTGL